MPLLMLFQPSKKISQVLVVCVTKSTTIQVTCDASSCPADISFTHTVLQAVSCGSTEESVLSVNATSSKT